MNTHSPVLNQKGVAVVTILLLTVLSVTIVSSLFWDQQVQIRSIENQRLQLQQQWILRGALDWAKLILMEDKKFSAIDDLTEPWNTPLMETRLDKYVEDTKVQNIAVKAFLSGEIVDAQSKFNLRRLANLGEVDPNATIIFSRLLKKLRLPPSLATTTAQALAGYQQQQTKKNKIMSGKIGFNSVKDLLSLPGFSPQIIKAIEDYTIFLPRNTKINVNTASLPVLEAELGITAVDARNILATRDNAVFLNIGDFKSRTSQLGIRVQSRNIAVETDFFLILGQVSINRSSVRKKCLIERLPEGAKLIWLKDI